MNEKLMKAVSSVSYRKVFILELLPLVNDYARREDHEQQKKIHDVIIQVYTSLNFPVIRVPPLPATERVKFILERL